MKAEAPYLLEADLTDGTPTIKAWTHPGGPHDLHSFLTVHIQDNNEGTAIRLQLTHPKAFLLKTVIDEALLAWYDQTHPPKD